MTTASNPNFQYKKVSGSSKLDHVASLYDIKPVKSEDESDAVDLHVLGIESWPHDSGDAQAMWSLMNQTYSVPFHALISSALASDLEVDIQDRQSLLISRHQSQGYQHDYFIVKPH